jgi:predicted nuclease with TOPRIM domain
MKIEALTVDASRVNKECAELKQRLAKLPELEENNANLSKEKTALLDQVGELKIELNEVKNSCVEVNKELAGLTEKLWGVQKEKDDLVYKNKDLMIKEAKFEEMSKSTAQASQAVKILQEENTKLLGAIKMLKANQTAPYVDGAVAVDQDKSALEENIQVLEKQKVELQGALDEWTALAKVSAYRRRPELCLEANGSAAFLQRVQRYTPYLQAG